MIDDNAEVMSPLTAPCSPCTPSLVYVPPAEPLRLVHRDDTLVVVDKPAGLLSVPGRGAERADCAASRVLAWAPDALVVHRLDMGTSGLLLFARGPAMQRLLSGLFMTRSVQKRYLAVVHGCVDGDEGSIDLPLMADWPRRPRQKVDLQQGKPSVTRWQVVDRAGDPTGVSTRLSLEPVTGRSHQLRVHMAALGHPIVGDELYGPQPVAAPRLHLHAAALSLVHPVSGAATHWQAPVPF